MTKRKAQTRAEVKKEKILTEAMNAVAEVRTEEQKVLLKTALFECVKNPETENVALLQQLINSAVDVHSALEAGITPLHVAAESGCLNSLQLLIKAGANIEATDSLRRTPIFLAAGQGKEECLQALIDAGANVNAFSSFSGRPIQQSIYRESNACMFLLLDAGADPILPGNKKPNSTEDKDINFLISEICRSGRSEKFLSLCLFCDDAFLNQVTERGGVIAGEVIVPDPMTFPEFARKRNAMADLCQSGLSKIQAYQCVSAQEGVYSFLAALPILANDEIELCKNAHRERISANPKLKEKFAIAMNVKNFRDEFLKSHPSQSPEEIASLNRVLLAINCGLNDRNIVEKWKATEASKHIGGDVGNKISDFLFEIPGAAIVADSSLTNSAKEFIFRQVRLDSIRQKNRAEAQKERGDGGAPVADAAGAAAGAPAGAAAVPTSERLAKKPRTRGGQK